jgi:uncharacterized damage-inducible protein DinB
MKPALSVLVAALLCPAAAGAQTHANPVSDTLRQQLQRESKNLTGAAAEMPADKYGFRPTEPQMTFGHLMMHIAQSNVFLCSKISGMAPPAEAKLSDTDPKDTLVQAVRASFDYCGTALAKVDDSGLGDEVAVFGGRTMPRAAAMMSLSNDWADHYSAAAIYLRLNGLLPPTAQPRK